MSAIKKGVESSWCDAPWLVKESSTGTNAAAAAAAAAAAYGHLSAVDWVSTSFVCQKYYSHAFSSWSKAARILSEEKCQLRRWPHPHQPGSVSTRFLTPCADRPWLVRMRLRGPKTVGGGGAMTMDLHQGIAPKPISTFKAALVHKASRQPTIKGLLRRHVPLRLHGDVVMTILVHILDHLTV